MHSYSRKQPGDLISQAWINTSPKVFRAELVARVRQEIALGTYDTPEKMELALEKLFKQVQDT